MKKTFIIIFSLLCNYLYGQDAYKPTIDISPKLKSNATFARLGTFLKQLSDGSVLHINRGKSSITFDKYSFDGKILKKDIELEFPKKYELATTYKNDNDIYSFIYKETNKKVTKVYHQLLDYSKCEFISEPKFIFEYESGAYNDDYYPQIISKGDRVFAFYNVPVPKKKKESKEMISVFDKDFKLLHQISIPSKPNMKKFYKRVGILKDKLLILNAYKKTNNDKFVLLNSTEDLELFAYIYSKDETIEREIKIQNNKSAFVSPVQISESKNNSIKFVGTYSDTEEGLIKGFINFSIDLNSDKQPEIKYSEIGDDLLLKYSAHKKEYDLFKQSLKKGKNKTGYSFNVHNIKVHNNGYYAIILQNGAFSPPGGKGRVSFWSRDFIVASFDNNDNLKWIKKAPGYFQSFFNPIVAWHSCIINGELILTHPWGLAEFHKNPEENWDPSKLKGGLATIGSVDRDRLYIIHQKFDKDGTLERGILCNIRKLDVKFSGIKDIVPKDENSMPFVIYGKKDFQFVNIKY